MSEPSPEMVVLADSEGRAIGHAEKSSVHGENTPLHLAFSCYITDASGRVLMTRRALGKKTWPGVWTNSCCGHPGPGETVDVAVRRRVRQELALELIELRLVLPDFRYRAVDAGGTVENEICPVYWAQTVDTPAPDSEEVSQWVWERWQTVVVLAESAPWVLSPWAVLQIAQLDSEGISGDDDRRLSGGAA